MFIYLSCFTAQTFDGQVQKERGELPGGLS